MQAGATGAAVAAAAAGELKGVPALPSCRIQLVMEESDSEAAAVQRQVRGWLRGGLSCYAGRAEAL